MLGNQCETIKLNQAINTDAFSLKLKVNKKLILLDNRKAKEIESDWFF